MSVEENVTIIAHYVLKQEAIRIMVPSDLSYDDVIKAIGSAVSKLKTPQGDPVDISSIILLSALDLDDETKTIGEIARGAQLHAIVPIIVTDEGKLAVKPDPGSIIIGIALEGFDSLQKVVPLGKSLELHAIIMITTVHAV